MFIIYIMIFVKIWVIGCLFIMVSTIRPGIAPGIDRAIPITIVIFVPLFTSEDKFEARRINITTFQDSQDEISELTSKF